MGIIKAKQLVHEYIRRDEEGNVESIQTALDHINAVTPVHVKPDSLKSEAKRS